VLFAVWAVLRKQMDSKREATADEFEDTSGNVLDKRTFDDLARQNLL
jgi:hypothetical protein